MIQSSERIIGKLHFLHIFASMSQAKHIFSAQNDNNIHRDDLIFITIERLGRQ